MLTKATVVGAGAMGTVAAQILSTNGVRVAMLARPDEVQDLIVLRENRRYLPGYHLSEMITPTDRVEVALANTELIVSAIPCQYLRGAWEPLRGLVPAGVPICSVTKGVEVSTLSRPSMIITEHVGDNPVAVLSGPSIAAELARCLPATVVSASSDVETAVLVQEVMSTEWFRVYTSEDTLGVELAGALKNIVALAAGILDGLGAGDNAKSALVARGLVEITRLGVALGAKAETFMGLAGVGDLVTTCISPYGRNRSAGERIGKGAKTDEVVRESVSVIEGIPTTRAVLQIASAHDVEMPITEAVAQVLFDDKAPLTAISELMTRPPKAEDVR